MITRQEGEPERDRIAEAEKAERCTNGIDNDCDDPLNEEAIARARAAEATDYNSSRSNKQEQVADVDQDEDDD